MTTHEVDLETLFSVPSVSGYDIPESESKRQIVYSTNRSGQWQLHLGDIDSPLESRQITFDAESKLQPVLFPDGKKVLYASDFSGDENYNLHLLNLDTTGVTNLTPGTGFAILPNATLSKDGKKIALVSNQSGEFATYTLDVETLQIRRISHHGFSDNYAKISPDGKQIVFSSLVSAQSNGIFAASLDNPEAEPKRLVDRSTGVPIEADSPEWSPDSRSIVFTSTSKDMSDIGLWNLESGDVRWLTKSDHEYYEPVFSNDGAKVAYLVNSGGDIRLILHDLKSEECASIDFKHGVVSSPRFAADGKSILFLFTGPRNPTDIWQYRFEDEKFVQLTNSLPEGIDVTSFVDGEQIFYPSKKDGMRIPALIYMPIRGSGSSHAHKKETKQARGKDTRENLPAVIHIHGGPTSQALNTWDPEIQLLVSKGIVVLRPNYRGSTGYGRKFKEANRFVMGDLDLADCVSGRDFLVERKIADPERVAVAGGSFGGYLTMCTLIKYPEGWACGCARVPFVNWFTEIQNERQDLRYWDMHNMGDPEKDRDRLREASPIFFVEKIKAPVMIIAGGNDPRCPLEESVQVKEKLEKLGKPVEFRAYLDEGHGFRKITNRIDSYKQSTEFLEKCLLKQSGS